MNGAIFSADRIYRYVLTRESDTIYRGASPLSMLDVLFICLNPSTADETEDDATVRRCIGFTRAWGYERLVVCNLFGLRATQPRRLYGHPDPVGPDNDKYLLGEAKSADLVVCAWGGQGKLFGRADAVLALLRKEGIGLHALGLTQAGLPRHPLYMPGTSRPVELEEALRCHTTHD